MGADGDAVWVTRTEPGATRLTKRLEEAGYRVLKQPLLAIEPIAGTDSIARAERGAAAELCIALSGHAVRFGVPLLIEHGGGATGGRWLAVGPRTANALARLGIDAEVPAVESSEGILSSRLLGNVAGMRVLLLCGAGGRELLTDELRRRGADVVRLETYRRRAVVLAASVAERVVASVGVVLAASGEVGPPLARAVGEARRAGLPVIAGSERIAGALRELGFETLMVADGPDDEAMLAALNEFRGQ